MNEAMISDSFNLIREVLISLSLDYVILDINKSAENIFRCKREQVLGKAITLLIPEMNLPALLGDITNTDKLSESHFDILVTESNDVMLSWTILPMFDIEQRLCGLILLGRYCHETKARGLSNSATKQTVTSLHNKIVKLSKKLTGQSLDSGHDTLAYVRLIYDYMEMIVAEMPGSVYWMNKDCVYLGCNENMAKLFHLKSRHHIVGKTYRDLYDTKSAAHYRKTDLAVMREGVPVTTEEPLYYPDGRKEIYLSNKVPLHDKFGNIIGMLGISIDITARKEAVEELNKAKKTAEIASKAKSDFIANMSHDIRTPITGIVGMIQDLLNTAEKINLKLIGTASPTYSVEDLFQLLKEVISILQRDGKFLMGATDELLQLCNEILEVTRLEKGILSEEDESFDIRELIQHNIELLQPVAQHKQLDLTAEVDNVVPIYLYGLRIYFDRICLNLIGNALKFTEKGFVKTSVCLDKSSKTRYKKGDAITLIITVEDSGIGIPKDKFQKIFEHFSRLTPSYQGTYKGSGLGLYTVKRYIGAMKGNIDVESEIGKGTRFIVTVPFTVSDCVDRPRESIRQPVPLREITSPTSVPEDTMKQPPSETVAASILVVEDNAAAAMGIRFALEALDCVVDIANNGTDALRKITSNQYDLILMDIGLPDISGVEVTRQIRALKVSEKSCVPIVALTAHASNEEKRRECFEAGMEDVISKPAQPLVLESILQHFVFQTSFKSAEQESEGSQPSIEAEPAGVIDWEACVHMCRGDPEFTRKMLSILAKDLKTTKCVLEKAYEDHDIQALRTELHRVRGGVCYLKLPQLDQALRLFHEAVKAEPQDPITLDKTYDALQQAMLMFWKVYEEKGFPTSEE